jgi:L-seryl-tRNA(Ser) seleniumtransferase
MSTSPDRRRLLQSAAVLAAAPALPAAAPAKRDFLKELGVRPIINAAGAYTMFTATLMRPETVQAIEAMSHRFVRLDELNDAVGKRIAQMLGAPAAMVTSGAAAALLAGTAGVLTGNNPNLIKTIPELPGPRREVLVQKSHRFPYDHLVRNTGIKLIEVETREQLLNAIGPQTAMLLYLNKADGDGQVRMEEFIRIGKQRNIPTFNDAAADVPPVENLLKPIRLGFDLTCVSGGKGIRGPQSAGILAGRPDLIAAARLNSPPNSDTIARCCKVNKEEMVGMMVALELFLKEDQTSLYREWDRRVELIRKSVSGIPSVKAEPFTPKIANQTPHLRVTWDPAARKLTPPQLMQKLREGDPSIEVVPIPFPNYIEIATTMMQPGEAEIVARRLREALSS